MPRKQAIEISKENSQKRSSDHDRLRRVSEITAAFVSHNHALPAEVATIIKSLHATLTELSSDTSTRNQIATMPAVAVRNSIGDDYIICLEDGKKLRTLKRYLRSRFNISPKDYRVKWHLPHDYPTVAPAYARQRSALAKASGLGCRPGDAHPGRRCKVA